MQQRVYVFKKKNKYRVYEFADKEKASRFIRRRERRGQIVQLIY